ncbi:MAG: flagellar biosynthesis protein FlhB [Alphaproteobacteria bacterium]|nr:MAG: flagellar biosynthesis protein FlhB [Alphaproteobacteria bacterium]
MADDEDQSSKTHDPTERKLQKLRDDGNVPHSKEVGNLFAVLGMVLMVGLAMPWSFGRLMDAGASIIANSGETLLEDGSNIGVELSSIGMHFLVVMVPLMLVFLVLGYLSNWVQNGNVVSGKPLEPDISKISLIAGLKRLFSSKSVVELLKSALKMTLIGGAMGWVMWERRDTMIGLLDSPPDVMLHHMQRMLLWLLGAAVMIMAVLALGDFLFQKFQYIAKNRMTPQELKEEMRDSEGDPHVRARQRQIRRERAQKRMMSSVPKADVVITNPTHYAVAMRYKPEEGDAAPTVVAKGVDAVAMRIREIATENGVPLYEDPPLARQLWRDVEIDESIPLELYEVVAKVIAFVMELKKKRR